MFRIIPHSLGCKGVPVASVGNLETYGLFPDVEDDLVRRFALDAFAKMYGGDKGKDAVIDFLGQTGANGKICAHYKLFRMKISSRILYPILPLPCRERSIFAGSWPLPA